MLLGFYLCLVIALPVALGLVVAYNALPRGRLCPSCVAETLRIRSRRHAILSGAVLPDELHARWCPDCQWEGTARVTRTRPAPGPAAAPVIQAGPKEPAPAPSGLEVRRVELDDGAWRVQLECWAEGDAWRGRLLFVGPHGRAWTDGRRLLTGRTAIEVFSKALSLSDQALVGRIRKATR